MDKELTNFPNGLSSLGIPVVGSGYIPVTNSNYWFVDGTKGNDGNTGHSLNRALKTIYAANAVATANDVILVLPGTYTESAITTTVAGLHFIGLGSATKQVIWTSATDTKTLTIGAISTEVAGFYMKPPTFTAGTPASIALSNASYAHIHHNRFQGQTGSYYAIYSAVENSDNVSIHDNDFTYMNTATNGTGIYTLASGGLSYSFWKIQNNIFSSNVRNIILAGARICTLTGNIFDVIGVNASGTIGTVTTLGIELDGTSSGGNQVHGNYLNGAYTATLYKVSASGDDWSGNYAIGGGTGVANGVTTANPA